ncbi:endolytic transglycosylase MltG [Chloroflexota bacterium]
MNRLKSCFSSALLVLGIMLCLALLLGLAAYSELPKRAERAFGPAAPGLDSFQRVYQSALVLMQMESLRQPANPNTSGRPFEIQLGESSTQIIERLQSEKLITDGRALRDYLIYKGLDTTLQAGEYFLSARMTPIEIAAALQDATPSEVIFTILPGWRLEEIAAALPTSGLGFSPESFMESASQPLWPNSLQDELPSDATLEGFLYPDRYLLSRQISAEALISTLLQNFEIKVTYELRQGFERQGLTLFEAVTLASIVEREAILDDEMPLIASVFFNRLALSMRLDTDPTVQYALGYNQAQKTWWTNPLSLADLQFVSPYNTYLNAGLPPGPIANPGLIALQAVGYPAETPYFYFRAACDGSGRHSFAETFAEHRGNACP